jgi:ribosome-associated protein
LTGKTPAEKTRRAAELAAEKKALDPVVLEIGRVSLIADYFLILSGTSQRHVQSLADFILEDFKLLGIPLLNQAGHREGRWVLLDYGDLVVHIFQEEERKFYNLERLWGHAPKVDKWP